MVGAISTGDEVTYIGVCICSYNDVSVLETYIHLLQLISTSEPGVQALGNY